MTRPARVTARDEQHDERRLADGHAERLNREPPAAGLAERLKREAERLGFAASGITRLQPSEHADAFGRWLEAGYHGGMAWLARPDAVRRRAHPSAAWPELRSVLVVVETYAYDPSDEAAAPDRGIIARYARGRDYHAAMKRRLLELLRWLETETSRTIPEARAYVDTGPVLERELARRAGLGWFGRNTMLIHPRRGSYFFLGALLLPLELPPDPPFEADHCGTCNACVEACPTHALLGRNQDGAPVLDANRCIAYLTIEHRGPVPVELRPPMRNRIFGCDICQEVCPWNAPKLVQVTTQRDYRPDWRQADDRPDASPDFPGTEAPSLIALMRMTREAWDRWTRGSAIRRAGYTGFKRNVAVAMGHWLAGLDEPPAEAVTVLRSALEDDEEQVREHAAWALEQSPGADHLS